MIFPNIFVREKERLENLADYQVLDTMPEKDFDDITLLASQICNTPISLVSLVDKDRQWFKSRHGLEERETPKMYSFCAHAINTPEDIFLVYDATKDIRFCDNPLVAFNPHVVFYAGVPLVSPMGYPLGTLCVIDTKPTTLTHVQLDALKALSGQVMTQLELRRKNIQLKTMYDELAANYKDIEQFSYIAAHDLKSPLNNIRALIDIIFSEDENILNEDSKIFLDHIKESAEQLVDLVDGIMDYSKATQVSTSAKEEFLISDLLQDILSLLHLPNHIKIEQDLVINKVKISKIALKQILMNLLNNSIKYLDTQTNGKIKITSGTTGGMYFFSVSDNGRGIPKDNLKDIFDLFKAVKLRSNSGTGLGLAIVKKLVNKLGGDVFVTSEEGFGATFEFKIKR